MRTTADTTNRIDRALGHPSLPAAFLDRAAKSPDDVALRVFSSDEQLTLGQWATRARAVAGGLRSLGVRPGDRVALLLGTRMEFHIADMGVLLAGAIPFSLYATSSVPQLAEIVDNAGPCVLISEAALAEKAREVMKAGPPLEHLVVIEDGSALDGELTLAELEARCPGDFDPAAATTHLGRDDVCTLVYTSGTTGPPKGVQFRHGAMLDCLDSVRQRFPTSEADRALSYLPMAHIAERIFGHYAAFLYGYEVTSLPDLAQLAAALRVVRPTRFFGVPRIYEKLLAGLHRHISASPDGVALRTALAARVERVRAEQSGAPIPPGDDAADRASLRPLAELTGLDQATFLVVAGAPSTLEVLEELTAIGLPINEFYGSSEVIIATASPPGRIRLGTAGTALPGVRLRLGDDGEVLIAGPTVTPGYFRDPARTAEVLDADGWLHTGDIGQLDDDGYLRIVDRKKALIINSNGKNMSPANIEQAIKGGQPLLAQVLAYGDRRSYNVALVVLDRDGLAAVLGSLDPPVDSSRLTPPLSGGHPPSPGPAGSTFAELTRHPEVRKAVAAAVDAGNERLSRVEQIKRFLVLDHDWVPGSNELTPTNKLKRREIATRYAADIDALYEEDPAMTAVRTDIETFAFWERDRAERMAAFQWLRENDPVSWHPPAESLLLPPEMNTKGFWSITKHAHIQEVSRSAAFCSGEGIFMEDMPEVVLAAAMSFLAMDPPEHDQLRGIVQAAFSPPRIRKMEEWIRGHARDVVAGLAPLGEADVVTNLAKLLPGLVYAHYIGVDSPELRDRVVHAADQLGSWNDPEYTATMEPIEVFADAAQTLSEVALELAELRRKEPGDDMVTWLVEAEFEGQQLEDWEIASFFVMLSGAANDTTGHVIAYSLLELDRHPEQKAWLLEDFEGRIDRAMEELMRWRSPLLHFRRTATADYEIGGKTIKAGDKVVLWYTSGNFDADEFPEPDRLDLTRHPNRHLAFGGGGVHYCLGAALGRQLVKSALREVYTQLPDIRIGPPEEGFSNLFNHMTRLPATWTPTGT